MLHDSSIDNTTAEVGSTVDRDEQSAMANVRASSRRTSNEVDSDVTIAIQSTTSRTEMELDSQMMEKVRLVSPHIQCGEPTPSYRIADSTNVNEADKFEECLVEDKPPPPCPRVKDNSQAAPAVPQRRKDADRASTGYRTNTLTNQYLGLLPGGLSQQSASQFVINGDHHDYINQDHLDAIMEEQEMVFEQEKAVINNGDKKHTENGSNYRLDESLADTIAIKGKVIVHGTLHAVASPAEWSILCTT